jgi:hypothetical protein
MRFISRGLMRPRSYDFLPLEGRGFVCLLVLTARNTASMTRVGFLRGLCSLGLAQPRPHLPMGFRKGRGLDHQDGDATSKTSSQPGVRRTLEMLASEPFSVTERLMLAAASSHRMSLGLVDQGVRDPCV